MKLIAQGVPVGVGGTGVAVLVGGTGVAVLVGGAGVWVGGLVAVGAGLGVTIAPACVEQIAAPGVVCRRLRKTAVRSDIELAYRLGEERSIVKAFCNMAKSSLRSVSNSR